MEAVVENWPKSLIDTFTWGQLHSVLSHFKQKGCLIILFTFDYFKKKKKQCDLNLELPRKNSTNEKKPPLPCSELSKALATQQLDLLPPVVYIYLQTMPCQLGIDVVVFLSISTPKRWLTVPRSPPAPLSAALASLASFKSTQKSLDMSATPVIWAWPMHFIDKQSIFRFSSGVHICNHFGLLCLIFLGRFAFGLYILVWSAAWREGHSEQIVQQTEQSVSVCWQISDRHTDQWENYPADYVDNEKMLYK